MTLARISVKTDPFEAMGTICSVDTSLAMNEILEQIEAQIAAGVGYVKMILLDEDNSPLGYVNSGSAIQEKDRVLIETAASASARARASAAPTTPKRITQRQSPKVVVTPLAPPARSKSRKRSAPKTREDGKPHTKRKTVRSIKKEEPLPQDVRDKLKKVKIDLNGMKEFLLEEQGLSPDNARNVMKQVEKLVTGQGITYAHWRPEIIFYPGERIKLTQDFVQLYEESVIFEQEHGRDKGNGWLLRHPIAKLDAYQRYYLKNKLTE